MRYTVVWRETAPDQPARIWTGSANRAGINEAVDAKGTTTTGTGTSCSRSYGGCIASTRTTASWQFSRSADPGLTSRTKAFESNPAR